MVLKRAQKPLAGKRVLVTRAMDQSKELINKLHSAGAEVVHIPTIEIVDPDSWEACDNAISNLAAYDWLIFSSTNGVQFFLSRLKTTTGISGLKSKKIAAVGRKTEQVLKAAGLQVDLVPEEYSAEGLVHEFKKKDVTEKRFMIPQAQKSREILSKSLKALGANVDAVPVYNNKIPKLDDLSQVKNGQHLDILTFTSPSTFRNFLKLLGVERVKEWIGSGSQVAAIGNVTRQAITDAGFTVDILAEQSTMASLVSAIVKRYL